jgi:hypothetical protein
MKHVNQRAVYRLKDILSVGKVEGPDSEGMVSYKVTNRQLFKSHILPLLEKYPFRGIKYKDLELFKEALAVAENPALTQGEKHEILLKLKEK